MVELVRAYLKKEHISNTKYTEEVLKQSLIQSLQPLLYPVYRLLEYKICLITSFIQIINE